MLLGSKKCFLIAILPAQLYTATGSILQEPQVKKCAAHIIFNYAEANVS